MQQHSTGDHMRLLAALLCLAATSLAQSPRPALTAAQLSSIDNEVAAQMAMQHIPGISIGVYSRGKILLAKGYGVADVEFDVPVKPETVFQSGSVGKQFTATGIMILVEEGKLSLDDPITKFFPTAPASWHRIKVKNLLSHTSGLADYSDEKYTGPNGTLYTRLDFTEDQFVRKIEAMPITFSPGSQFTYCNTNYLLLGAIIHQVTGQFYADFLAGHIFKPLHMTTTRLISEADIIPNRASGYELDTHHQLKNQSWVSPSFNTTADGALYFSVLDLAQWDAALYTTQLLRQSSLDQMFTPFPLNNGKPNEGSYGFGWEIDSANGHRLIEHTGSWQGFTCIISRYPDDALTIVVLTNLDSDHANPDPIAHHIAAIINPDLPATE